MQILSPLVLAVTLFQQPSARIEGIVTDATNGTLLTDVQVLASVGSEAKTRAAVTDGAGTFSFAGVVPGETAVITLSRAGYWGSTMTLRVIANVPNPRRFTLTPATSVSGRIYDSDRHPVKGLEVRLLRDGYDASGLRTLDTLDSRGVAAVWQAAKTDEKGEYRIQGFPPGEYYIRATYPAEPAKRTIGALVASVNNIAPTYYPGVTSADRALPLKMTAGMEMEAVDFAIEPLTPFKISGRIVNSFASTPVDRYSYFLVPRDVLVRETANVVADMDPAIDRFEIRNVPPGPYDLYVAFATTPEASGPFVVGKTSVNVVDHDVRDIVVAIETGIDVVGKWNSDDSAPPKYAERAPIVLRSLDGLPEILVPPISLRDDGSLEVKQLPPGRYRLSFRMAQTVYVAVARFGAQDVLGKTFEVDAHSDGPFLFEFSTSGGTVEGIVTDKAGKPVAQALVVFVPAVEFRIDEFSSKTATTDAQGHFVIRGIRPGAYTAFATTDRLMNGTPYLNSGVDLYVDKEQHLFRDLPLILRQ